MDRLLEIFNTPIKIGGLDVTLAGVGLGIALMVFVALAAAFVRRFLRDRILPRAGLARGVSAAIASLTYYLLMCLGVVLVLPVMIPGFGVQTLAVIFGAISFGIGFGLRNIADNFVSGLILLIERPIKVGDRIEVGNVYGDVVEIRARATIVRTNDHIDIIVPNSEFVSGRVTNVSFGSSRARFRFPVGVHYRSDVHVVARALVEAGMEVEGVLKEPRPEAGFIGFGESSLDFELWVWTETLINRPAVLQSAVNFKIWEKLKKYEIEVPYPQRDIYIKEAPGGQPAPSV